MVRIYLMDYTIREESGSLNHSTYFLVLQFEPSIISQVLFYSSKKKKKPQFSAAIN